MTYRVTFDRIGRGHHNSSTVFDVARIEDLPDAVAHYAGARLGSRGVDVLIDPEAMTGRIIVGFCRPAGSFTVAAKEAVA